MDPSKEIVFYGSLKGKCQNKTLSVLYLSLKKSYYILNYLSLFVFYPKTLLSNSSISSLSNVS